MYIYIYKCLQLVQQLFNIFNKGLETYLRVSEANEVPISSHIWVALSTLNRLYLGNEAFWTYGAGNKKCLF